MKTEKLSFVVSESIGAVSATIMSEGTPERIFVFAHGAGAGMDHPFMVRLSTALSALGTGTMRFNFPYMEKGGKRPDVPAIAEKTVLMAIETAEVHFPEIPLLVGGKSFGGRMTSQALSKVTPAGVKGVIFVGFPLHAAGNPGTDRARHLSDVKVPLLFLQGTRDALANISLIRQVTGGLPRATLVEFEGADHSFRAGKQDLIPSIANAIAKWTLSLK
jgi:predicted alpha/beta-hydrolase family hydrolase